MQAFDWLQTILRLICKPTSAAGMLSEIASICGEKWDEFSWKTAFDYRNIQMKRHGSH